MLADNSPNTTTDGATLCVADVLLGGIVFFKVEETIFEVPRHRFTQYSEVFADMFLVPQAEGAHDVVDVEGRDKEHPILLEGYQAADFAALVKILYPSPDDMISGSYALGKQEWVGVLNLSTRWQMKLLRNLAITKLSRVSLTPVEKVGLARAHKVATWLKEGLSEIVKQEETLQPDELEAQLGLRTAFRLVWIQSQSLKRPPASLITMRSLGCPSGHVVFLGVQICHSCSRQIVLDDPDAMFVCPGSVTPTYGGLISLKILRCKHCSGFPRNLTTYFCPSCGSHVHYNSFKSLAPPPPPSTNTYTTAVEEQFKEEIASYESWDQ